MQGVKAIFFDTFGSVVDWRGSLIAELSAFGSERGINIDWTAFIDEWRGAYKPSMDRVRTRELPWTILDQLHRASLEALLAKFGVSGLAETDLAHLTKAWHRLYGWPDAVPGLTRLKTRYVIAPLSNGNVALLVNLAKFAGLPWDMVFGSEIPRAYKPDPEVYLGACAMLGLQPEEVMMAAAHNYDLAAARALGLKTGFFARPTEYGPHQTKDLRAESDWDVVAKDIEDLATQMGV
jgi:2-haloacid dehalogenase